MAGRRAAQRRAPGQLETALLAVLWASGGPLTAAEAQERLAAGGDDLAYTSVMTTLARLHAKGLADREARGRAYAYSATHAAAVDMANQMESLLGQGPARTLVLSEFVSTLGPDDEVVLRDLLRRAQGGTGEIPPVPQEES